MRSTTTRPRVLVIDRFAMVLEFPSENFELLVRNTASELTRFHRLIDAIGLYRRSQVRILVRHSIDTRYEQCASDSDRPQCGDEPFEVNLGAADPVWRIPAGYLKDPHHIQLNCDPTRRKGPAPLSSRKVWLLRGRLSNVGAGAAPGCAAIRPP